MTSPKPLSITTYTLPNLVRLDDDSQVDELKALTKVMQEHLQRVRFQVFLGEIYRQWPLDGVDSVRFSFEQEDERDRPMLYANCEGSSKTACHAFRYLIQNTGHEDEGFLKLIEPFSISEQKITRQGMESLWRTFVGPEAVAQHLDANLEGAQGQSAPKLRM